MRRFLRTFLTGASYRLAEAASGEEAIQAAVESPPDLILLDLGLPDMDGQEVIRRLREWLQVPIIVVSVRDQDKQKILALTNGADDYLTKPFSTGELLARIQVAFRHSASRQGEASPLFSSGELQIDLATRRVRVNGDEVRLTRLEHKLLLTLAKHAGKVLTHQFLLSEVWGPKRIEGVQHLRVFMAGLRRKIELEPAQPRYLLTEQGVGYRLAVE
ncbi:MAG: DNA-binding response regulator [Pirellula sp.]|nr:DNA-binding response regulator [Pirellula sp.]